jgi:hypothetical protein
MTSFTTFDILKGAALIATFFGFLAMCAALVHWHDKTWKIAVEPTKASVFRPIHRAIRWQYPCRWIIGEDGGRRVVA